MAASDAPWFTVRLPARHRGDKISLQFSYTGSQVLTDVEVETPGYTIVDASGQCESLNDRAQLSDLSPSDKFGIDIRTAAPGPATVTLMCGPMDGSSAGWSSRAQDPAGRRSPSSRRPDRRRSTGGG